MNCNWVPYLRHRLATQLLRWSLIAVVAISLVNCGGLAFLVHGQEDVVITRRKNSQETVKRRGVIKEWKGLAITITNNAGEIEIENEAIVEVQTSWQPGYLAGLEALKSGDPTAAITLLRSALAAEQRAWAKRIIRADLVRAYRAGENDLAAIEQFLQMIQDDPQSRFFHHCPLPWLPTKVVLNQPAQQWIKSDDPAQQLIGASWLLTGNQRQEAIRVLEELSNDIDANIRYLAISQLWRTRKLNVNARQIEVWKSQIGAMPKPLRAGPWLVLAEAQARLDQIDEAIINFLRIPILYPDQIGLSAAALYRAGYLLHNTGRSKEAQMIWSELRQQHPDSLWAQQAPASNAAADAIR